MPRRKQRQLSQKVRFDEQPAEEIVNTVADVGETAPGTQLAKVDLPAVVENNAEQDENGEGRDNAGMPRRSRRSPRHLRVSGQRRRRYRDERYPTQSPMPLTVACASPEMASGKVWIRYPVARPEQAVEEQVVNEEVIAPGATVEAVVTEAATVVEPQAVEAVEVETTHPEVIAAPVDAAPQLIAEEDSVVVKQVVEEAQPAAMVEETPETVVETVAEEEVQDIAIDVEPVREAPEVKPEPVVAAPVPAHNAPQQKAPVHNAPAHVATAPMTRAPAPEYVAEAPRQSDWVRPDFNFDGKGSAGGHSASHQATAPATRPQSVD